MISQPALVLITHEFPPRRGGVATYCRELATALRRAGVDLSVWAPDIAPDDPAAADVAVCLAPGRGACALGTLRFAAALRRRRDALRDRDVIFASLEANRAAILLDRLGWLPPMRMTSLLHGTEILRLERSATWRALARRFYRRADQVIVASPYAGRLWQESFLGSLDHEVVVAPCAAGSDVAVPVTDPVGGRDRIRILTLGRLHPRKGQLDLARALARLPAAVRERILYQVAGPGDRAYLAQVQQECRAGAVAFEYLGNVPPAELAAVYAACDLFAMTPRRLAGSVEGFGIVYLEAGQHGKPVIAWRSGGVADAVIDGETGLLVDEGDRAGLTAAVERLVTDADLRRRLGEGGRRHAARFSWDRTAAIVRRTLVARD